MRHEQATAYAADGWARTTGTPGVCCVTAGCGLTNAVTGLCVAGLTGSAVVCLSGQHPFGEDGLGSFQEAYGADVCRTFSKFTHRVLDWYRISFDVRQAFRQAMTPPQGVSVLEIPTNILYHQDEETDQVPGAKVYYARRAALARRSALDRSRGRAAGAQPSGRCWSAATACSGRARRRNWPSWPS